MSFSLQQLEHPAGDRAESDQCHAHAVPQRTARASAFRAQPSSTFGQNVRRHRLVSIYSRPQMLLRLLGLIPVLALVLLAPGPPVFAAQGPSVAALRASGAAEVSDVYVRLPRWSPGG